MPTGDGGGGILVTSTLGLNETEGLPVGLGISEGLLCLSLLPVLVDAPSFSAVHVGGCCCRVVFFSIDPLKLLVSRVSFRAD